MSVPLTKIRTNGTALRTALVHAVKRTAAAVDWAVPPPRGVVVLAYHRVGATSGLQIDLPLRLFRQQMESLAERGSVLPLDDALAALEGHVPGGPDPVVVTFDDGTADFATAAFPVLNQLKIPVTLYVSTQFIEERLSFPNGGHALSWQSLRELVSTGLVTVGSHTHSHRVLGRVGAAVVAEELDRSLALIEDRLGTPAQHFAYPKAVVARADVEHEVRRRFRSAAVAGMRPNRYGATDPYRLNRSAVQVSDGMRWFERKVAGGMAAEGGLRSRLDRHRYAGVPS